MQSIVPKLILMVTLGLLLTSSVALAQDFGLKETINQVNDGETNIPARGASEIPQIIGSIINSIAAFIGTIMVVLLLVGGYRWMTAGGNEEKVMAAKKIIISAIDGIIVVFLAYALAYTITFFFSNAVTG